MDMHAVLSMKNTFIFLPAPFAHSCAELVKPNPHLHQARRNRL
jgi:hypothetical protein